MTGGVCPFFENATADPGSFPFIEGCCYFSSCVSSTVQYLRGPCRLFARKWPTTETATRSKFMARTSPGRPGVRIRPALPPSPTRFAETATRVWSPPRLDIVFHGTSPERQRPVCCRRSLSATTATTRLGGNGAPQCWTTERLDAVLRSSGVAGGCVGAAGQAGLTSGNVRVNPNPVARPLLSSEEKDASSVERGGRSVGAGSGGVLCHPPLTEEEWAREAVYYLYRAMSRWRQSAFGPNGPQLRIGSAVSRSAHQDGATGSSVSTDPARAADAGEAAVREAVAVAAWEAAAEGLGPAAAALRRERRVTEAQAAGAAAAEAAAATAAAFATVAEGRGALAAEEGGGAEEEAGVEAERWLVCQLLLQWMGAHGCAVGRIRSVRRWQLLYSAAAALPMDPSVNTYTRLGDASMHTSAGRGDAAVNTSTSCGDAAVNRSTSSHFSAISSACFLPAATAAPGGRKLLLGAEVSAGRLPPEGQLCEAVAMNTSAGLLSASVTAPDMSAGRADTAVNTSLHTSSGLLSASATILPPPLPENKTPFHTALSFPPPSSTRWHAASLTHAASSPPTGIVPPSSLWQATCLTHAASSWGEWRAYRQVATRALCAALLQSNGHLLTHCWRRWRAAVRWAPTQTCPFRTQTHPF